MDPPSRANLTEVTPCPPSSSRRPTPTTWPTRPSSNTDLEVTDKYTGEVATRVAMADESTIDAAIGAADEAKEAMAAMPAHARQKVLEHCVARFTERQEEMAQALCIEAGKPIRDSRGEVTRLIDTFKIAAEEAVRIEGEVMPLDRTPRTTGYTAFWKRVPIGPCSFISPFNFPLNLSAHKIGPALAAGNSVLLKPPVQCPTLLYRFAEIAKDAGLPDGALNVLHCNPPAAERLVTDERIKLLSFTGSAAVGWRLKQIAGKKRVLLELGNNAGAIVHKDADVKHAAQRLALGAFFQSGQVCISAQRLYIHDSVADEFTQRFLEAAKALPVGDPQQKGVVIGPMIDEASLTRVVSWVEEAKAAGANILLEGKKNGTVLSPIVLTDVPADAKIACEEVFGPVVLIERYSDFDDALDRINASRYGLQASIFTHDIRLIERAYRTLDVGGVIVNDFPIFRTDNFPYGGIKDSGLGREGVRFAFEEMTEIKMLVIHTTG